MNYEIKPQPMICASAEAEAEIYHKVQGKSGKTWLVPLNDNASRIHVDTHDPQSDGYGGRTLAFQLSNGETYYAKGPWNSNPDALFDDTGVDLRDKHVTFVVLSKDKAYEKGKQIMVDVVYIDPPNGLIGSFNRYKEIAKLHPEANYYYSESEGGSSSGPLKH